MYTCWNWPYYGRCVVHVMFTWYSDAWKERETSVIELVVAYPFTNKKKSNAWEDTIGRRCFQMWDTSIEVKNKIYDTNEFIITQMKHESWPISWKQVASFFNQCTGTLGSFIGSLLPYRNRVDLFASAKKNQKGAFVWLGCSNVFNPKRKCLNFILFLGTQILTLSQSESVQSWVVH